MTELMQKERLQPALLDRLTDDEPHKRQESRERRVLSLKKLKQCVLRDMAWLLNTTALDAAQDLEGFDEASHSVINYGIPDLTGKTVSDADIASIERRLKQAIWDFEPRILRDSVKVRVSTTENEMNHNAMSFDIEGDLWAQPLPMRLYIKTEIDLDIGNVDVIDKSG